MNMNEPKLRFKADDGSQFPDWEEKKLGEIADFFNGDRSARYPKETDFVKYGVAFLNTENLHNTIVDISEKCKYITYEKYCELSGAKIQLLDIIYCLRGSVGLCSLNTILEEGTVASSLMVIRAVDGIIDPIYLYNSLNSDLVLGQLYQCLNGSCAGNLSAKDMAMFKIKCPCLAEQQKIAEFLSTVDTVIAKQRETVSAWEERKKGVMQKLFSQEVRFKADDGSEFSEWEEKKIGEILAVHHGKDYKNLKKGNVPVYGTGGIITYVEDFLCDWACVCIGRKGTIDKPLYIDAPFWCVDTLFFTKAKDKHIPKFQFYLFQMIPWKKYNEASGVPSLNASTIQNINVTIPCLEEQQKIADCLSSLDEVIEKQKATMAAWEELKKGLLQQMFA